MHTFQPHRHATPIALFAILSLVACFALAAPADAAGKRPARVGHVNGESSDNHHAAEIEVVSWSWNIPTGR